MNDSVDGGIFMKLGVTFWIAVDKLGLSKRWIHWNELE
jgi:hypothetical protein